MLELLVCDCMLEMLRLKFTYVVHYYKYFLISLLYGFEIMIIALIYSTSQHLLCFVVVYSYCIHSY
jgi:hypothetical protein